MKLVRNTEKTENFEIEFVRIIDFFGVVKIFENPENLKENIVFENTNPAIVDLSDLRERGRGGII